MYFSVTAVKNIFINYLIFVINLLVSSGLYLFLIPAISPFPFFLNQPAVG